jgi:hypothetical protein
MDPRTDSPAVLPYDGDVRNELARLIAEAFRAESSGIENLHLRVCAFVRERRDAGDPPERVVVALKDVIDRATICSARTEKQSALVETMIRWCINEYYQAADSPPRGPEPEHP